ncbi:MAG: type II secretion system protein [Phycisphaerae bacterium]
MEKRAQNHRGFTLIELLVVVAIIALLISILLPSLSRAKEQARVGVCLSNQRSIAQAASAYLPEFEDLPWVLPRGYTVSGRTYNFTVITEYIWGGAMPASTNREWRQAGRPGLKPSRKDNHQVPPRHRPLNPYFSPDVTWDAEPTNPPARPREDQPETPGFFQCPSDSNPFPPVVGQLNPPPVYDDPWQCWYFWGTSYPINWYWPYYYQEAPPGGSPPYRSFWNIIGAQLGLPGLGRHMLRAKLGRHASEFIMFYENQLNFALEAARPPGYTGGPWASESKNLRGWHRQMDYHVASFLDGSARYQRFDTRFVFGTNWTIWPTKPWGGLWEPYNDRAPD